MYEISKANGEYRIREKEKEGNIGRRYTTLRSVSSFVETVSKGRDRRALFGYSKTFMSDEEVNALERILDGEHWNKIKQKALVE